MPADKAAIPISKVSCLATSFSKYNAPIIIAAMPIDIIVTARKNVTRIGADEIAMTITENSMIFSLPQARESSNKTLAAA
jgi:hypothetical protein